jgi:hypothetical protein
MVVNLKYKQSAGHSDLYECLNAHELCSLGNSSSGLDFQNRQYKYSSSARPS